VKVVSVFVRFRAASIAIIEKSDIQKNDGVIVTSVF
jgi:hypothetical protein